MADHHSLQLLCYFGSGSHQSVTTWLETPTWKSEVKIGETALAKQVPSSIPSDRDVIGPHLVIIIGRKPDSKESASDSDGS